MKRLLAATALIAGLFAAGQVDAATICGSVTALGSATTHNYITTLGNNCVFSIAQPTISDLANVGGGTVLGNTTGSAGAVTATVAPVLGIASSSSGSLQFANANTANAITVYGGSTTTGPTGAYNFNLPITVGSAGQALVSEGGGTAPMQWTTIAVAQFTVTAEAASWTVTSATDGTRFNNTGSSGTVVGTLPTTPSAGDNWCFMQSHATNPIQAKGATGETINYGGVISASAGTLQSAAQGAIACLYFDTATTAYVWSSTGAWVLT